MTGRRKLTQSEFRKFQLYQQLMSYQLSWCLAYAALFVTTELGILFFAIQLKEAKNIEYLGIIGIGGIVIGLIFLWFYYVSAREMDMCKDKILEAAQGTDMEDEFEHWRSRWYRWNQKAKGGLRLLWIVPVLIILWAAWQFLVF